MRSLKSDLDKPKKGAGKVNFTVSQGDREKLEEIALVIAKLKKCAPSLSKAARLLIRVGYETLKNEE